MNIIPAPAGLYSLHRSPEDSPPFIKVPVIWMAATDIPLNTSVKVRYWDIEGNQAPVVLHSETGVVHLIATGGSWQSLDEWLTQA